jgi:hypothetical protein
MRVLIVVSIILVLAAIVLAVVHAHRSIVPSHGRIAFSMPFPPEWRMHARGPSWPLLVGAPAPPIQIPSPSDVQLTY